jgi:hypothetical protein
MGANHTIPVWLDPVFPGGSVCFLECIRVNDVAVQNFWLLPDQFIGRPCPLLFPEGHIRRDKMLAGATGLEPATFGVTGQQFNLNIQGTFQLLKRRNEPKCPDQLER